MSLIVSEASKFSGLLPGDVLISSGDRQILNFLDFMLCQSELFVVQRDGEVREIQVDNIDVEFVDDGLGELKRCHNNCVFCFIDQNPKGMRETIYVKDDDAIRSFMLGNFSTLTNLSDTEFDYIIDRRLMPLNISVHSTDDEMRTCIMRSKKASGIMDRLTKLKDAGLKFSAQIVLIPGYNDGENLERTLTDLSSFHPYINSVAVVPVGLTMHREGLPKIKPVSETDAKAAIRIIEKFQRSNLEDYDERIIFAADELYIRAGEDFPDYDEYENFDQRQDGVGLVVDFLNEAHYVYDDMGKPKKFRQDCAIATGVDFAQYLKKFLRHIGCDEIDVFSVVNHFYGETVSVTGLLSGNDIVAALGNHEYDELLIGASMLRDGHFIDNMSVAEVERKLNMTIIPVYDAAEFIETIVLGN